MKIKIFFFFWGYGPKFEMTWQFKAISPLGVVSMYRTWFQGPCFKFWCLVYSFGFLFVCFWLLFASFWKAEKRKVKFRYIKMLWFQLENSNKPNSCLNQIIIKVEKTVINIKYFFGTPFHSAHLFLLSCSCFPLKISSTCVRASYNMQMCSLLVQRHDQK